MIYLGSYPFLYNQVIEKIKDIRKTDKTSKISFIIFSNPMRRALKQYISDELNILYNSEFFTKIDIARNMVKENSINDLEKRIILKIILEKNNNYIKGIEEYYSEIFQSLKEEKVHENNIPDEVNNIFKNYNSILKEYNIKDREDLIKEASNFNFKTDYIFIFGFQSLSLIDRELFQKILDNNDKSKVNVFLPLDIESSIYKNNKYLATYINFFKSFGLKEIYQDYINDNIKITRLINSKKIINQGINSKQLNFIKVKGKKQEINYLAKYILSLRENNISWNKIGVIINDIESYIDNIKEVFSEYHIPYYLSNENRYIDDINFKKIFSLFNLKVKDFSKNNLLNSLSSEILNIENFNINELEKTLIENSFEDGFDTLKKFLNNELIDIFIDLNNIDDEKKLIYFVDKFEEFINKYFKENKYKNKILEILNEIKSSNLFINYIEKINLKDFNHIILKYLEEENKDNRKTGDIVQIATPTIALSLKFEHLFFIDMNEGKFPLIKDDNYILNKHEKLKELISKKDIIYSQQIITFINLLNSTENIYIFYKELDDKGNELSPSIIVEELLIYQFSLDYKENNLLISENIIKKENIKYFKIKNSKNIIDDDLNKIIKMNSLIENENLSVYEGFFDIDKLYKDKKLSPSQLQTYIECPYRFFIKYIINPDIININNLEKIPYDKEGEIIHKILEDIYKKYKYYTENNHLIVNEVNNKFTEYFEPFFKELKESSIIFEKIRISQVEYNLIDFIKNNLDEIKNKYEIYNLEYQSSIEIKDYKINGRIDRIDKSLDTDLYNIYDYKTSAHKEIIKEIQKGNYVQLYIYKEFLKKENKNTNKLGIFFVKEIGEKVQDLIYSDEADILREKIEIEIDLLNKNFFSPYTKSDKCIYCDYSSICGKDYRNEDLENKFSKNKEGIIFSSKIKGDFGKIEKN